MPGTLYLDQKIKTTPIRLKLFPQIFKSLNRSLSVFLLFHVNKDDQPQNPESNRDPQKTSFQK